jgi:hypothetical protein
MLRATRILIGSSAVVGSVAICMAASAQAVVSKGTLSGAEYRQLSAATVALNRSASAKAINWAKAHAACRKIGGATTLLKSQRTSCLDSMTVLEALENFPAQERRCAASIRAGAGTTTTGTTTTSTSTATAPVIRLMVCMSPRYQRLGRDAKAFYTADIVARKQAISRGLTGSCLATLVTSPANLKKERLFAAATGRLAADVKLLIRVTEGKAPTSDFSQTKVDSDVKRFETAATAVLAEKGPQKLSTCPHE